MKYFLTLALFACSLVGYTQVSASFNPDYNGDGYVGVDDILGVLSHYDTPWEADAAENMVVDSLETIIAELSLTVDSIQSDLEEAEQIACIPALYPLANSWEEWGTDWQIQLTYSHQEIEAIRPGYMSFCQLASWQAPVDSDCYTDPGTGETTCFWPAVLYDAQFVLSDLQWFVDQEDAYGYAVPSPACLLSIQTTSTQHSCEEWSFSEHGGGIGGTATVPIPSGSGAVKVDCGGIDKTWNIYIPGSFAHAFINGIGGINCNYNIHYNPNTTTLVGSVGGIDNNSNYLEDTSL